MTDAADAKTADEAGDLLERLNEVMEDYCAIPPRATIDDVMKVGTDLNRWAARQASARAERRRAERRSA